MNLRRLYDSIESNAEELVIKEKSIQDGTFMKAPNGKTSNLTESQWLQVRTKNFINWFGDWINHPEEASKVLDKNGEPLIVYHGSRKGEFECFDPSKGNPCSSGALYFSNSLEFAKKFSGSEGHNYEVYLRINNPLRDGFNVVS